MVRKLNKLLSVLLVVAMMFTYVAPWKALAVDESPESEPGMSDTGEPGGTNVPEGDGTDATNGPEDDGTDGQTVSHENYFGEDGLYHVWTPALTCTDDTHHAHDASSNRSTEPVCGVKESAPVLTCTIEENHTHSVENGCYVEISEYEYYYYRYTEGSGSVTTSGSGRNTKYYYLSCTTPEGHTHGDECYTPATRTRTNAISAKRPYAVRLR